MNGRARLSRWVVDGLVAGSVGAVLGGVPSTVHALVSGTDPLEASLAAGSILLPHEDRPSRLLPAAFVAHGSISLFWALLLAATLPRHAVSSGVASGAAAGLGIAALDLGVVGRRISRVRRLQTWPQLVDHVLYGAAVGGVLAFRGPHTVAPSVTRRA